MGEGKVTRVTLLKGGRGWSVDFDFGRNCLSDVVPTAGYRLQPGRKPAVGDVILVSGQGSILGLK